MTLRSDNLAYTFNPNTRKWEPEDTPLLRIQFDSLDELQARHPKPMKNNGIRKLLAHHLVKCGLRTVEHPAEPNSTKRVMKAVENVTLRSYFCSVLIV
jgi:hypothetical protein